MPTIICLKIGTSVVAAVDSSMGLRTIRHRDCEVLLSVEGARRRCPACDTYRKALHSMVSQRVRVEHSVDRTAPDSHVNYRWLSDTEKDARMKNLHTLQRQTKMSLDRLTAKTRNSIENKGTVLDEESHGDMAAIMKEHSAAINARSVINIIGQVGTSQITGDLSRHR